MGLGIIGTALAGAAAGVGTEGAKFLSSSFLNEQMAEIQKQRDARLEEFAKGREERGYAHGKEMLGETERLRREGRQADIEQDVSPANVQARAGAVSDTLVATREARVADTRAMGTATTDVEIDRFTRLAPAKRQEVIDTEVAKLRALSTPEMLKAEKAIAQAKHIVDPNYTAIGNEDGTVTMVNTRNPQDAKQLKVGGVPVVQRNSEGRQLATAALNYAAAEARTARQEHQTALSNAMGDKDKERIANEAYQEAQERIQRIAAPALATLGAKMGIPAPAEKKAPSEKKVPDYGAVIDGYRFIGRRDADPNDRANWEPVKQAPIPKSPQGVVNRSVRGEVPPPPEKFLSTGFRVPKANPAYLEWERIYCELWEKQQRERLVQHPQIGRALGR